jgi:hypothetical protein
MIAHLLKSTIKFVELLERHIQTHVKLNVLAYKFSIKEIVAQGRNFQEIGISKEMMMIHQRSFIKFL